VMNILSIVIFLPFIDPFARWLSKRFHRQRHDAISLLSAKLPVVPEVAIDELHEECENVLKKTRKFIRGLLKLNHKERAGFLKDLSGSTDSSMLRYGKLKQREGRMLEYYSHIQGSGLSKEHFQLISQYMITVRYSIRGAKSMKDIHHDLKEFESSLNDTIHMQYEDLRRDWEEFDTNLEVLLSQQASQTVFEELTSLMKGAFKSQQRFSGQTMESLKKKYLNEIETSTLMNVQYEILSVKKSLLRGIAHLRLSDSQAEEFEFLPEH
jgi:phosphate:Na+ symporter